MSELHFVLHYKQNVHSILENMTAVIQTQLAHTREGSICTASKRGNVTHATNMTGL